MGKLSRKGMSYRQQAANSGRGISAKQYNGLVNMHKDIYQSNAGGSPTPQGLQQSVIANAVLHPDGVDDIPPYSPVRIRNNMTITNPGVNAPSYEVLAVDESDDTNFMMSYGFTLGEGISVDNGGRVVVSGVAYASVTKADLTHSSKLGTWDSLYYVVNDGSLMTTANHSYLSPVGHFRLLAWNDLDQVNSELAADTDEVLLMIDLDTSPDSFVVTTDTTCDGVVDDEAGTFTMTSIEGSVRYSKSNIGMVSTPAEITLTEPTVEAENYKVLVYNMSDRGRPPGSHSVEYSKVYGCYVFGGGASSTFQIEMTKVGGTQGTSTAPCSFTYDLKMWQGDGSILYAAKTVVGTPNHYRRPNVGQLEAATFGTATYNSAGDLVIIDCNETLIFSTC